jgi:hypothetical protein
MRRTQEAVESLDTLVHARDAHGLSPAEGPRERGLGPVLSSAIVPRSEDLGMVLDRYRLLEHLGSGGFGVVWRAHDELLHREVAVKRISLPPDGDSERATREALATARLAHPAIVALYEACAVQDAFYLISELVHGDTLARLIATDALADEEVLEIGIALTGALAHAHARGVIHRDVKPHNVLVPHRCEDPLAVAKLTDFGGARLAGEDVLTRTGDVLGTLAYMAPEQSEGHEAGEQADLYSLALVLYEALSGVNPVRGSTTAATARRIGQPLPPLERARGDLPRSLTRALDIALAPHPTDRGSIDRLRLELEHALARGLPRRGARRMRRRPPAERAGAERLDEGDEGLAEAPAREGPARILVLPRRVWLACGLAAIVWQGASGRPGVALLLLAATLPLAAILPQRSGPGWLACTLAPMLGLLGLAGAFPAVAGQAPRWTSRAALGALGYWWLTLSEPLLARRLWLGHPPGAAARGAWEGSFGGGAHLVGGMLSLGVLFGAVLWAAAAVLLPWLVRGHSAMLDAVMAVTWSAALLSAVSPLARGLSAPHAPVDPRGAVLGAVFGAVLAVAARALRGPV